MEENKEVVQESPKKGFWKKVDDYFGISQRGSSFKVEIFAGLATFLAMSYILTVNPNQFFYNGTANANWSSVFIATAFGAIIGTLLMAFLAKMPYAQASGMGLNATVGSVIGGGVGAFGYGVSYSLGNALLLVLVSGFIFLLLSVIPAKRDKETGRLIALRELIFDGVPKAIRTSITVGIGLFIAYIGLQKAGLIIHTEYTQIGIIAWSDWISSLINGTPLTNQVVNTGGGFPTTTTVASAFVCVFGVIVIAILHHYKVKGSVILGILAATIIAIPLGVANIDVLLGKTDGITWKFWENFASYFSMDPENGGVFLAAFTEGFNFPAESLLTSIMLVITFCMIDMFDTMGTVVGCSTNAGLIDEDGKPLNYSKIMYADSIATCTGAIMGTSTVTTFVESGAGIAEGGKTGFTALTTAILFFLAIFLLPVFAFIPGAAAASALIYVGVLMISNVKNIDFTEIKNAVPAFFTIIMMPLSYSITNGIGCGIVSYVVLSLLIYVVDIIVYAIKKKNGAEKPKWEISIVSIVIFVLFLIYFLVPTVL